MLSSLIPFRNRLKCIPYFYWVCFALFCRWAASLTHSHWFHPDEWYQTLEPANLIAHGFGLHSQEIGLHLRNLTWPTALAGILKLCQYIAPNSIEARYFWVNFTVGILDLGILWGWIQLLESSPFTARLSSKLKGASIALLLLPWYTLYHSVNPRAEHLSEIALWIALGCLANRFWARAGFASVAVFGFRYPSVLLSLGIYFWVLLQFFKTRTLTPGTQSDSTHLLRRFSVGMLLGLVCFGIADLWIYGRAWESLWMYLQFNVFTGSGALLFGRQGIAPYFDFFAWNWGKYPVYIPIGTFLAAGSLYGLWRGLLAKEAWALCIPFYLIGHLLIGHKEGRFMIPIETLFRWSGFVGLTLFFQSPIRLSPTVRSAIKVFFILFLFINGAYLLHSLRADLGKIQGTYRELGIHLKEVPQTCAVLTRNQTSSLNLPFQERPLLLTPPVGSYRASTQERPSYQDMAALSIRWTEDAPDCAGPEKRVLIQVPSAESAWTEKESCTLLSSSVLRLIPHSLWDWALRKHLAHGVWYHCPPNILTHFQSQSTIHVMSHRFGKIETLPRLGITPQELEELGQKTSPPPANSPIPSVKQSLSDLLQGD